MKLRFLPLLLCLIPLSPLRADAPQTFHQVQSLRVTTLSTMLASQGIGEWGYAALIEVDGRKILFDTGHRPETVLDNARELGIELGDVEDVILSHNHGDHTGGLLRLREALTPEHPKALSRVHVGRGIFSERIGADARMSSMRAALQAQGVEIHEYTDATQIYPGVWLTGNVERVHPERNWGGNGRIRTEEGDIEDTIPEDLSLVIDTAQGFVLISGCGHAGIINTMEHVVKTIHPGSIDVAIGGFHLVSASDEHLSWTAEKLKSFGMTRMMGAHCTGIDALYTLRRLMQSDRSQMVVGAVGDQFSLEHGVRAAPIAR
jgi:7,8-dihydropterin-6-yl-methyl-4-(beta-D-ribofuranosyl)aminobenzene 5'-phosphate synthase